MKWKSMNQQALEGGARLHAILGLMTAVEPPLLDALIQATAPNGEEPNPLSYKSAVTFRDFQHKIATIAIECQKPPATKPKPGSVQRHTFSGSSRSS